MNREQVIGSAQKLLPPSAEATADFAAKQDAVAAELSRRMLARPDLERLIGADNQAMLENNSRNMLRFMASLFRAFEPLVLTETALWAFTSYRAHGFRVSYWPANLDTTVEILKEELSADSFAGVYPSFEWLITSIPAFTQLSEEALISGPGQPQDPTPSHG
jgi:hypothetical protein